MSSTGSQAAGTDPDAATQVEAFLGRHANTYVADRLRLDWALALADRGDFTGFERETAQLVWNTDDNQLRCCHLSKYRNASGSQVDMLARDARQSLPTRATRRRGVWPSPKRCWLTVASGGRSRINEQNQLPTAKRRSAG
jgi:hypothetical protein